MGKIAETRTSSSKEQLTYRREASKEWSVVLTATAYCLENIFWLVTGGELRQSLAVSLSISRQAGTWEESGGCSSQVQYRRGAAAAAEYDAVWLMPSPADHTRLLSPAAVQFPGKVQVGCHYLLWQKRGRGLHKDRTQKNCSPSQEFSWYWVRCMSEETIRTGISRNW